MGGCYREVRDALDPRLVELGVPHDYAERPGGHTWKYRANAVQYQVLFFAGAFRHAHLLTKMANGMTGAAS